MGNIWPRLARTLQNSSCSTSKPRNGRTGSRNRERSDFPTGHQTGTTFTTTLLSDHPTFQRIQVGQTRSELLADLKALTRFKSRAAGPWSNVAPDGSALFVRDLSTDEIYALDLELP